MTTVRPHTLAIPQERLDFVLRRLGDAHWPDQPDNAPNTDGVEPALVRAFVDHVTGAGYDWRAQEAAINALPSFVATIDGYDIHFLRFDGADDSLRPLVLIHGWPGGFLELVDAAERLAKSEGRTVIVPSLPGYGLSSKPKAPIGPRLIAALFDRLMREALGFAHYIAQGGDWGSVITSWLGYEHPACEAIHINFHLGWAVGREKAETADEQAALARNIGFMSREGAYIGLQATKPLTLSYAMSDSPLGAAAWIIEKFNNWSDLRGAWLWDHYDRDRLATLIMIYLLTDSFGTAAWLYRGMYNESERIPAGARVAKPTGVALFPAEIGAHPQSLVGRVYDIVHWSEPGQGGHFAAFEQPEIFVADVSAFLKTIG